MPVPKGTKYNIKPKERMKRVFDKVVDNGIPVSRAMVQEGYSKETAKAPTKLTKTKGWEQLMKKYIPDELLAQKHNQLLNSTKIEHMTFPLGPKGEDDINLSGTYADIDGEDEEDEDEPAERTTLTDQEIIKMLAEVNCQVKRIVHAETCRHVYYWCADAKAMKDAIDMGYKLKGSYQDKKAPDEVNEGLKILMVQINNIINNG